MRLPFESPEPVLALGGHLQVEACMAVGQDAFRSEQVGDLDTEAARSRLIDEARLLESAQEREADVVAIDLHPDYPSTWFGERLAAGRGARLVRVQHHVAHAASVLGEHGRFPLPGELAAAIVLDGTGFGPDAVAWGCEWLLIDGDLTWSRPAHGTELALVGGERAVREPWRVACAALASANDIELLLRSPLAKQVDADMCLKIARLSQQPGWPRATGAGRVFEAAGALFGLCTHNSCEGEAAIVFEALAAQHRGVAPAWLEIELPADRNELPTPRLLALAVGRLLGGEDEARVAAGFHATFARLAAELTERVVPNGCTTVALGGGCLVNRLLASGLERELTMRGFVPLLASSLPPGDGGLAYGQAVVAAAAIGRGFLPCQEGDVPCALLSR